VVLIEALEEEAFDIIENIEAITEDDKKEEAESDSSDSTITEDKDSPKTEGGSIKQTVTVAVEAFRSFRHTIHIHIRCRRYK
jgi:hypothetical protein